jgi:hypothetical protein
MNSNSMLYIPFIKLLPSQCNCTLKYPKERANYFSISCSFIRFCAFYSQLNPERFVVLKEKILCLTVNLSKLKYLPVFDVSLISRLTFNACAFHLACVQDVISSLKLDGVMETYLLPSLLSPFPCPGIQYFQLF